MLAAARAETDALFQIVRPEFLYDRPIPERHRIVFYIGHLEAFDWNLLRSHLRIKSFHPEYDRLFAFGIDPVEGNLPTDQPEDWPTLDQVYEYRDQVRANLADADVPGQLRNIALEHRLMHGETLAYIFHQMEHDKKQGCALLPASGPSPEAESIQIPAGYATLGLRRDDPAFGWDNEYEAITVDVPPFLIDKYKVTNGQYLRFLEAGGYNNRALWTEEAWAWKSAQNISHPAFWLRRNDRWYWRGMFEALPLPLDGPVYVSHAEASAYAKWAGRQLPTEAQWHRSAYGEITELSNTEFSNVDLPDLPDTFEPLPVNSPALTTSPYGAHGMIANGWEWTSTRFAPLPNFQAFDEYPGYSAPFFDDKHYVLKGGSARTAASMLRPSFRNWFQPHYQYAYAGFRCMNARE